MTQREERTLGVDFGDKRIGLALSDPLGMTAQPLEVLRCVGSRRDLARICEVAEAHRVVTIVVGLPLRLSGEEGEASVRAREFAARLALRLPSVEVRLWDERLSTAQAERTLIAGDVRRGKRRQVVDLLAAVLILQSYLDARGAGEESPSP